MLGGETKVVSLTNPIKLKIPAGTHSGQIFRLKGKGIAKPNGSGYGDQLVKVNIEIPKKLTRRQKTYMKNSQQLVEKLLIYTKKSV